MTIVRAVFCVSADIRFYSVLQCSLCCVSDEGFATENHLDQWPLEL